MAYRPRQSTGRTSTPPPSHHNIWAHHPSSMSNPSLSQHSRYPLGYGRPQQLRHNSDRFTGSHRPLHSLDYKPSHSSFSTSPSTEGAGASSTPKAALKMFSSVKRSFSINTAKKSGAPASLTISTAEETAASQIRISESASSKPPPTVQQIAAGLVSRPSAPRRTTSPRAVPTRSSLKNSTMSNTSSSSSTSLASTTRTASTTTAATSVASSGRARFSFKDALFRRSASVNPTPMTAITRKAVRFHVDRSPTVEPAPLPSS